MPPVSRLGFLDEDGGGRHPAYDEGLVDLLSGYREDVVGRISVLRYSGGWKGRLGRKVPT